MADNNKQDDNAAQITDVVQAKAVEEKQSYKLKSLQEELQLYKQKVKQLELSLQKKENELLLAVQENKKSVSVPENCLLYKDVVYVVEKVGTVKEISWDLSMRYVEEGSLTFVVK